MTFFQPTLTSIHPMPRRLPPFPAVRAFEAAARLGSFRAAGDELAVTPSAISHQIRKLEEHLATRLFDRDADGPVLNTAGRAYLERLTPVLDELEFHTKELFERDVAETLSVRGTPCFIARWLIPRLPRLRAYTGLDVRLSAALPPTDFSPGDVDVIIHWGGDPVDGVVVEPFLSTPKIAVASPSFLRRHGPILDPLDLGKFPLLRDEVGCRWKDWLAEAGVADRVSADGQSFPHCEMVLTAVERDQGIGLAYAALVEADLAERRLVQLFDYRTEEILIYSVAYPVERRRQRSICAFRDWIMSEVTPSSAAMSCAI